MPGEATVLADLDVAAVVGLVPYDELQPQYLPSWYTPELAAQLEHSQVSASPTSAQSIPLVLRMWGWSMHMRSRLSYKQIMGWYLKELA